MTKQDLTNLIKECVQEVKLKITLKTLIRETVEEIKADEKKTVMAQMDTLGKEVCKDPGATLEHDDAGNFVINGLDPHYFNIRQKSHDNFDVVYMKDKSDREKKLNLNFGDLKKYIKEKVDKKTDNYVNTAYNKNNENSKDKMTKSGDEKLKHLGEKAEDMVKDKTDLPDQPMKEVSGFKKQNEHKGEKVPYVYPKQDKKQKNHIVKLKGKKLKT